MSSHTAQTELKLIGKLIVEGDIVCQTGLHIGAGKGSLEIGGADNPVVKDAFGLPYVPGSSLRGKLRSLLEQSSGLAVPSELVYVSKRRGQEVRIHQSERPDDEICLLFGRNPGRMERVAGESQESSAATPARLTVYDAPLIAESITPQMRENMDDELTEVKSENAIDRITSQANPRTLERVPAGARFHFRIVLDVLCPEDRELLPRLIEGLRLLEDDSLGGGGSRGNGRIALASFKLTWRGRGFYASGAAEQELLTGADAAARAVAGNRSRFRGETRRVGMSSGMSFGMHQATSFAVRFRPMGPWRFGPDSGARDRVDLIYHSDAVFSAVCSAMSQLGLAEAWFEATATAHASGGALQLLLSVRRRNACWWFLRAASGRRLNRPRSGTRARTSFRCR